MLRILVFLGLASLAALGAVWLAERPGEVSIVWSGVTVETTVAVAAIGVIVLVLLGMLLWTLLRFMLGLPTAFSFASRARKRVRGFDAVSRGMVAVGAGDPAAARRHAADAQKLIAGEPLTLLLSAQAAQLSGDKPAAEAAFKNMLDEPSTRVLGLRGLFVEARRRGDQISARAFADEAVRLLPSLAWANDALLEFHSTSGEWSQARTAVERRAALRLSDKTESKRHRAVLLAAEAEARQATDPAGALANALEALKLAPGLTPSAVLAGRMLAEKGDLRKAARTLESAWREQPHPDLARIYTHLRHGDSASDRLEKAEALMKLRPTDAESAFIVADAAIEARDFARARQVLSPLVAAVPTVRTCLLMARIEDAEHGSAGRAREWLTRSTRAPRDNAWVADGITSETWLPVSPVSGRLDAFVWSLPPAAIGSAVPAFSWPTSSGPAFAEPAFDDKMNVEAADVVITPQIEVKAPVVMPPAASPVITPVEPVPAAPDLVLPDMAVLSPADQNGAVTAANGAETKPVITLQPVNQLGEFQRAPDDPGPETAPAKRSFWGFGRG